MSAQLLQESAEYLQVQVSEYFRHRGGVDATPEEICEALESQVVVDTIINQICSFREPEDYRDDHHNYQPVHGEDVSELEGDQHAN